MRYRFIDAEKAHYPVDVLCRVLQVSRSGFYAWRQRAPSLRTRANAALLVAIRALHRQSRQTYGSPRITRALRAQGAGAGRHRIARLMRRDGLRACYPRRYRMTTASQHRYPVAANVLARHFRPTRPNQVWAGDITYIWTTEGWLYLAVLLDLYARRVIGWSVASHLRPTLPRAALHMALQQRRLVTPVLHHSDQGVQYAAAAYQALLKQHAITCSMSRKGDCWDNAVVESFFKTLKVECVYRHRLHTRPQAQQLLFEYMEVFYNRQRLHSTLDYRTPVAYEAMACAA